VNRYDWILLALLTVIWVGGCTIVFNAAASEPAPELKTKHELLGSPCEWPWYAERLDRCSG
jgi:hypothetical protein